MNQKTAKLIRKYFKLKHPENWKSAARHFRRRMFHKYNPLTKARAKDYAFVEIYGEHEHGIGACTPAPSH